MKIEPAFSFPLFNFQLPREKLKTMLVHNFGGQISCIVGLCGSGDLLHCTFNKANLQIKPSYTVGKGTDFPLKIKALKYQMQSKPLPKALLKLFKKINNTVISV